MPWFLFFEYWVLSQLFHSPLSPSSRGSLVHLRFLPWDWCYLHMWGYWKTWFQLGSHPTWHFAWCALHMLNKQGDSMHPWCTPFPIWNQSVFSGSVIIVISWPAYRFLRRQVSWSGIPISLRTFNSLLWSTLKRFSIVNETEVDVYLKFPHFFHDPVAIGNFISGSSAFSKSSLYIQKFSVHTFLKPTLEDFEHYLASMWNKTNYTVF